MASGNAHPPKRKTVHIISEGTPRPTHLTQDKKILCAKFDCIVLNFSISKFLTSDLKSSSYVLTGPVHNHHSQILHFYHIPSTSCQKNTGKELNLRNLHRRNNCLSTCYIHEPGFSVAFDRGS